MVASLVFDSKEWRVDEGLWLLSWILPEGYFDSVVWPLQLISPYEYWEVATWAGVASWSIPRSSREPLARAIGSNTPTTRVLPRHCVEHFRPVSAVARDDTSRLPPGLWPVVAAAVAGRDFDLRSCCWCGWIESPLLPARKHDTRIERGLKEPMMVHSYP